MGYSVFLRKYLRDLDQITHRYFPIGFNVHGTYFGGCGFKMASICFIVVYSEKKWIESYKYKVQSNCLVFNQ